MSSSKRRRPAKHPSRVASPDFVADPAPEPVMDQGDVYDAPSGQGQDMHHAADRYDEPAPQQTQASAFVADQTYVPAQAPVYAPQPTSYAQRGASARAQGGRGGEERIGDILRAARLARGEDLLDISDYLRIRPNYLVSLEECQYEDLPADAYVIGFLRSYALYLGLDGKKMIDHYRREMAGRRRKPQLSMPQPVSEGRAPTVAILIAAALAALAVYGLWYVLATSDRAEVTAPPALPEVEQPIPDPVPLTQSGAAPVPVTVPTTVASTDAGAPAPEGHPTDGSAPVPQGTASAAPDVAGPATTDGIMLQGAPSTVTDMPAKTPKGAKPEAKTESLAAPEAAKPDMAAPLTEKPGAEKPVAEKPAAADGQSFGAASAGHVVIRAVRDSWILITDARGNTVFDKTLKAGDSYNVPNDQGLTLTTGNAGGLQISVDGAALPAIASGGRVVRAVPLEPERLKNRIAEMNAR